MHHSDAPPSFIRNLEFIASHATLLFSSPMPPLRLWCYNQWPSYYLSHLLEHPCLPLLQCSQIQMIFLCPSTSLLISTPNPRGHIPWTMLPSIFLFSRFSCQSFQTELTPSRHHCAMNLCWHYLLEFPVYQINWVTLPQNLHFVGCPHQWFHSNFFCRPNILIAIFSKFPP